MTDEDVATRWITYERVVEEPPQAREITYMARDVDGGSTMRTARESDAEYAYRSRYGTERKVPYYREEAEEQPVRQVRFEVETTRETVVVPYYVPHDQPAPRTIEDFQRDRNRGRAEALTRHLDGVERNLDEDDAGAIIEALTDEERDQGRRVVDKLKAALDEGERTPMSDNDPRWIVTVIYRSDQSDSTTSSSSKSSMSFRASSSADRTGMRSTKSRSGSILVDKTTTSHSKESKPRLRRLTGQRLKAELINGVSRTSGPRRSSFHGAHSPRSAEPTAHALPETEARGVRASPPPSRRRRHRRARLVFRLL